MVSFIDRFIQTNGKCRRIGGTAAATAGRGAAASKLSASNPAWRRATGEKYKDFSIDFILGCRSGGGVGEGRSSALAGSSSSSLTQYRSSGAAMVGSSSSNSSSSSSDDDEDDGDDGDEEDDEYDNDGDDETDDDDDDDES